MIGMTAITNAEKKHPKLTMGISGAVVLSVLVMGGNLTYQWGRMAERVNKVETQAVRESDRREIAHANFVTRVEYQANNDAVLRELQRTNETMRDLARHLERLANTQAPR